MSNVLTRRIMNRAEDMKLLPVDSKHYRTGYVIDPEKREILVMTERHNKGQAIILPFQVVRELCEIAEVYCG